MSAPVVTARRAAAAAADPPDYERLFGPPGIHRHAVRATDPRPVSRAPPVTDEVRPKPGDSDDDDTEFSRRRHQSRSLPDIGPRGAAEEDTASEIAADPFIGGLGDYIRESSPDIIVCRGWRDVPGSGDGESPAPASTSGGEPGTEVADVGDLLPHPEGRLTPHPSGNERRGFDPVTCCFLITAALFFLIGISVTTLTTTINHSSAAKAVWLLGPLLMGVSIIIGARALNRLRQKGEDRRPTLPHRVAGTSRRRYLPNDVRELRRSGGGAVAGAGRRELSGSLLEMYNLVLYYMITRADGAGGDGASNEDREQFVGGEEPGTPIPRERYAPLLADRLHPPPTYAEVMAPAAASPPRATTTSDPQLHHIAP